MQKHIAHFGWRKDSPDQRDLKYNIPQGMQLPDSLDISTSYPYPPGDQMSLGSCVGWGIKSAIEFEQKKQGLTIFLGSALWVYWYGRHIEGTVNSDSGMEIRDGIKVVNQYGICKEDLWPYNISLFTHRPPYRASRNARLHKAIQYLRVNQTEVDIKSCIVAGYPVIFGITCYDELESDETAKTGLLPLPKRDEQPIGGHCIDLCGFNNSQQIGTEIGAYKFRNSWSTSWGQGGYGWIPYSYVHNPDLASDFWTIRLMENSG